MAQRFQNGITLNHVTAGQANRTLCRYIAEFLVNVVGWSKFDVVTGTRWDNYVGSGSTASTTAADTIDITSPSYVFTASDVGHYLTLTGFSNPSRDGIYRIMQLLTVAGSVYTLLLEKSSGPHELGMPVGDSGISWKFWRGEDAYTPVANDVIVLQGEGKTGAGLTNGTGTGDSIAMSGSTATLTDAAATFQTHDVGKYVTVSGASNSGNNGKFQITARLSATQIQYVNASGVNETSSFTWAITYPFHLHLQANASQYHPSVTLSPFASWNASTNSWNDAKRTSQLVMSNSSWCDSRDYHCIQVEADIDHITISGVGHDEFNSGAYQTMYIFYVGELDTFTPELDPRPVVQFRTLQYQLGISLGSYQSANNNTVVYGLSWDDITTLSYRLMYNHTSVSADSNYTQLNYRNKSMFSKKLYRLPLIVESITASHMELRGKLRNMWITGSCNAASTPFGVSLELLHTWGGVVIPWNGSRSCEPKLPSSVYTGP